MDTPIPDNPEEESKDYVTCLSTERLFRYAGIPSEGILGQILRPLTPGERITPGNFAEGPVREILEQDIFGEFQVKKGRIVPGSYRPHLKPCLLTEDGFFQLGPELEESLLEVLAATPDPEDEAESHVLPN